MNHNTQALLQVDRIDCPPGLRLVGTVDDNTLLMLARALSELVVTQPETRRPRPTRGRAGTRWGTRPA